MHLRKPARRTCDLRLRLATCLYGVACLPDLDPLGRAVDNERTHARVARIRDHACARTNSSPSFHPAAGRRWGSRDAWGACRCAKTSQDSTNFLVRTASKMSRSPRPPTNRRYDSAAMDRVEAGESDANAGDEKALPGADPEFVSALVVDTDRRFVAIELRIRRGRRAVWKRELCGMGSVEHTELANATRALTARRLRGERS
jgi:hypothetical protein